MSLADLERSLDDLPYALKVQVVDYARSVREAARDIAANANIQWEPWVSEELMWVAALKRLYAIVDSAYWTIDNANRLLQQSDIGPPVVGATDYSTESMMYQGLFRAMNDLAQETARLRMSDLIHLSWPDVLRRLRNER